MSTRGSIGYIVNGKFSSTYNHSDSYPSGLGEEIVEFCKTVRDWEQFKANLAKVKFADNGYVPTAKEIEENKHFADLGVSNQKYEDLYCLLRNVQGADQLHAIRDGKLTLLEDSGDFIKDSLFCEYAYILNLDTNKLEFWEGFQKEPHEGNRFGQEKSDGYYPCKMVGEYSLTEIPEDWQEKLFPQEQE